MASCEPEILPTSLVCAKTLALPASLLQAVEAEGPKTTGEVTVRLPSTLSTVSFSFIVSQLCQWNKHSIYSTLMILREYLRQYFVTESSQVPLIQLNWSASMNLKKRTFRWLMGIKRAPHGENNRALQSREGVCVLGEGGGCTGWEATAGPVLGVLPGSIPIAHSRDISDIIQTEVTKPKTTGSKHTEEQVLWEQRHLFK